MLLEADVILGNGVRFGVDVARWGWCAPWGWCTPGIRAFLGVSLFWGLALFVGAGVLLGDCPGVLDAAGADGISIPATTITSNK